MHAMTVPVTARFAEEERSDKIGQYLTFMLGGEVYGLAILAIKEIIQYGAMTMVPMMPDFIRGVINLRGRVVPVVDLCARLGRGSIQVARRTSIIIVEVGDGVSDKQTEIGMMVDAVNEVVDISEPDIEPAPLFGAHIRTEFIQSMARHRGQFMIVLNLERVLSMDELSAVGHPGREQGKIGETRA